MIITSDILASRTWTLAQISARLAEYVPTSALTAYSQITSQIPSSNITGALSAIFSDIDGVPTNPNIAEITEVLTQLLNRIQGN